jgi:hypothetical protein
MSLVPWLLELATALIGFVFSFFQRRDLVFPKSFLAYFVVGGAVQLYFYHAGQLGSVQYMKVFWFLQVIYNLLLFAVSIEIAKHLLPGQYVTLCTAAFIVLLVVAGYKNFGSGVGNECLQLSRTANYGGGMLLLFIFLIGAEWTIEYALTARGVLILVIVDLVTFGINKPAVSNLISQIGPLPGLLLLSVSGLRNRDD